MTNWMTRTGGSIDQARARTASQWGEMVEDLMFMLAADMAETLIGALGEGWTVSPARKEYPQVRRTNGHDTVQATLHPPHSICAEIGPIQFHYTVGEYQFGATCEIHVWTREHWADSIDELARLILADVGEHAQHTRAECPLNRESE